MLLGDAGGELGCCFYGLGRLIAILLVVRIDAEEEWWSVGSSE